MRQVHLEDIVDWLQAETPRSWHPDELAERMARWQVRPESMTAHLHFVPGRYTRNLVFRNDAFELVLNCWSPGALSPVHEHAGQDCWVSVQAGAFDFENYPLLAGGRAPGVAQLGRPVRSLGAGVGFVDYRSTEESVHRVASAGGRAVSLHLYAKPIDQCLVFDPSRQRCMLRSLRYDTVPPGWQGAGSALN